MNRSSIALVFSLSLFLSNASGKPSLSILLMLGRPKSGPHHDGASLLMFYSTYWSYLFLEESCSTILKIAFALNP